MACSQIINSKELPKPVLIYCQLDPEIYIKVENCIRRKYIWIVVCIISVILSSDQGVKMIDGRHFENLRQNAAE